MLRSAELRYQRQIIGLWFTKYVKYIKEVYQSVKLGQKINRHSKSTCTSSVKDAVLKGDTKVKIMVAFSVYDTRLMHFITTSATSIKWVNKNGQVHNTRINQNFQIEFLRTKFKIKYNDRINDIDISDQLRKIYSVNCWLRNLK